MAERPLTDRLDEIVDALVARGDATAALRDPGAGAAGPDRRGSAPLSESGLQGEAAGATRTENDHDNSADDDSDS